MRLDGLDCRVEGALGKEKGRGLVRFGGSARPFKRAVACPSALPHQLALVRSARCGGQSATRRPARFKRFHEQPSVQVELAAAPAQHAVKHPRLQRCIHRTQRARKQPERTNSAGAAPPVKPGLTWAVGCKPRVLALPRSALVRRMTKAVGLSNLESIALARQA